jgi:hypothetical protein
MSAAGGPAGGPADIPGERPASLDRLDALIGDWETRAGYVVPGRTAVTGVGRTTFEWLQGRSFLIQRFVTEHPAAPSGIAVIAAGEQPGTFSQHYYDSRGVARVYQMSLADGVWKLWREAAGFWQRYRGVIADDGRSIEGAWDKSADGRDWAHDFALTYIRRC